MQKKVKILIAVSTLIFPLSGSYGPMYDKKEWQKIRKEVKKTIEEVARQEATKRAKERYDRKATRDTTG